MTSKREAALRRVRGPVGMSLAAGFLGQAVLAATGTLAARLLGPADRGHMALLLLLPPTLCQLGTLGVPLALTYHIARDRQQARPLVRSAIAPALWQAAAILVLNVFVVATIQLAGRDDLVPAALVGLLSIPGWVALQYGLAILQGRQDFLSFNAARLLPVIVYLPLLIACYAVPGDRLPWVLGAWVAAHTFAGVAAAYLAVRGLPQPRADADVVPGSSAMVRFGMRSLIGSISPIETLRIDQAIVGFFLGAAPLGLYVAALAFTNLPKFVAQSFGFVAYPRVAAARAESGSGRAAGARLLLMALALVLPVSLMLFAGAGVLIHVFFGSEFDPAVTPLRVLLVGALCMGVRRVLAECARGSGFGGLDSIAEAVLWAFFLPAAAVMGDRYGLTGLSLALAAASVISLASLAVLFWLRAGRSIGPLLPLAESKEAPVTEGARS